MYLLQCKEGFALGTHLALVRLHNGRTFKLLMSILSQFIGNPNLLQGLDCDNVELNPSTNSNCYLQFFNKLLCFVVGVHFYLPLYSSSFSMVILKYIRDAQ